MYCHIFYTTWLPDSSLYSYPLIFLQNSFSKFIYRSSVIPKSPPFLGLQICCLFRRDSGYRTQFLSFPCVSSKMDSTSQYSYCILLALGTDILCYAAFFMTPIYGCSCSMASMSFTLVYFLNPSSMDPKEGTSSKTIHFYNLP